MFDVSHLGEGEVGPTVLPAPCYVDFSMFRQDLASSL